MQSQVPLQLGQKDAKKLLHQHCSQLVCVRYRYDEPRQRQLKTVELIIGRLPWHPKSSAPLDAALVSVHINLKEVDLQRQVKQAGGKWNRARQLWDLRYDQALALGLADRIEPQDMPNSRKAKLPNNGKGKLPTIR